MLKKPSVLLNVIAPVALGVLLLYQYQKNIRKASEIGLGAETTGVYPKVNEDPIHLSSPSMTDGFIKGWITRGRKPLVLWLGNSQLHGVNQFKEGQANCISYLFEKLQADDREVVGVSYPNANLQEFLASVIYYSSKIPLKTIILPVFFDDMREDGIRGDLQEKDFINTVHQHPSFFQNIESIHQLKIMDTASGNTTSTDYEGIKETAQEISEKYLNEQMEKRWSIWKDRANFRGNLFNDLYLLRNFSLGISATSVRKMIPARFQKNYDAFVSVLEYCKQKSISLIVYIPPIRNDEAPPYEIDKYQAFKGQVQKDCYDHGAAYLDLENVVPVKFWGYKGSTTLFSSSEIDFMHFQSPGHQMIADTVYQVLKNQSLLR